MLGSITRDPIFCSKARILLQVKNIFFRSLMITKRLLDGVSCELKKGGPVEAMKVQVKSSSISLLVFTFRKGISQFWNVTTANPS
jgi:hypothetical protein